MKTATQKTIERIKAIIQRKEELISKNFEKLKKDFVYELSWKAEETWKACYSLKYWKELLDDVTKPAPGYEAAVPIDTALEHYIAQLRKFTSKDFNVRERSTNEIGVAQSIWKFEESMSLQKEFSDMHEVYELFVAEFEKSEI